MSSLPLVLWRCPPKTALVAVDFGDTSARALALDGAAASAFDARLRALHAERFEPPPYFTLEQIAGLEAARRVGQAAAIDHLARVSAEASAYRVESIVVDEPPVEAILREAATADLIIRRHAAGFAGGHGDQERSSVMGHHGFGGQGARRLPAARAVHSGTLKAHAREHHDC